MRQIKTFERVFELADQKKAVVFGYYLRRMPAAFIQNWGARMLWGYIKAGRLFEYKKGGRK